MRFSIGLNGNRLHPFVQPGVDRNVTITDFGVKVWTKKKLTSNFDPYANTKDRIHTHINKQSVIL
jgi:hypothetical protein